ncbi:coiled-coil domain-containing protein 12-like isoform X1 [Vigna umbellata]|uniref:coiled-coil domain-containing protein 12-like isoform X1 n=1 Tax=Vigna umbellata TaxID=87088 RepID=UPI001F5ED5F8|nr:coiled-coil domain-containing protein 12-like isoform X1 [Vigna umbellata]
MGSEEDSIEQSVASRRERLLALRAAQELSSAPEPKDNDDAEEEDQQQEMKFRNYVPHDKNLQEGKLAPAVLPKFEDPVDVPPLEPQAQEDPFLNIAPKKPNWDLRRDVQKKFDKLEKRTQKALYQLMVEQEKQKQLTEGDDTNGTAE